MKKIIPITLAGIIMVISCGKSKNPTAFTPVDEISISATKQLPVEDLGILNPTAMKMTDRFLIFEEANVESGFISVMDLSSGKIIHKFAQIGPTLSDIMRAEDIDVAMLGNTLNVGIIDASRNLYKNFTPDVNDLDTNLMESSKYINQAVRLDHNTILISTIMDSTKYFIYTDNVVVDSLAWFPPKADKAPLFAHSVACSGWLSSNPRRDLIVSTVIYDGGFEVLEVKNDKLKPKWNFRSFEMDYDLKDVGGGYTMPTPNKNSRYGYTYTALSDKYIYALFVGKLFSENNTASADVIHVFDYDGNHIRLITLDHKVTNICVDPGDRTIYCLSTDKDARAVLLEYALPEY